MNTASTAITASPAHVLLKKLRDNFPVFRNNLPLAIGIDKQIIARLPEIDRKILRNTLAMHTRSSHYLLQMAKAKSRFDLDGNAVKEVTESHRTHAATTLRERTRKNEEHRSAQRELERKMKRDEEEAEAARKHTEKLNQLAEKFSRGR
jgi:ProP effector